MTTTTGKPIPWPIDGLLPESFFARHTEEVARDLLGKILLSRAGDVVAGGRIVETEAYLGWDDPGSHASTKGMTSRNSVMFGPPGRAYVYFTYGMHHMLNLISEAEGVAGGILIRAIEPRYGLEVMKERRRGRDGVELTNGPGKVAEALGVDLTDYGTKLGVSRLGVFDDTPPPVEEVMVSGRIGLAEGHDLDLRFYLKGDPWVSRGKTGPNGKKGRRGRP